MKSCEICFEETSEEHEICEECQTVIEIATDDVSPKLEEIYFTARPRLAA